MRKASIVVAGLAFLCFGIDAAQAHKLKVFATAVGADISGYAYFVPGGRAQEASVTVQLPNGQVVETLHTNVNGEFSFHATNAADHSILVDAGDGHEASYTVRASEISADIQAVAAALPPARATDVPTAVASNPAPAAATSIDIGPVVEQAVARQLRPLREQIDAWQEKIWFHDVLGGLGYIIGIAGLFYGLTGTRRARAANARRSVEEGSR